MDKYQEFLLDNIDSSSIKTLGRYIQTDLLKEAKNLEDSKLLKMNRENNNFTIVQDKNPNALDYTILIAKSTQRKELLSNVEYFKKNKWFKAKTIVFDGYYSNRQFYVIPADFENKTTKIKFKFESDLVDDLEMDVVYESITKEQEKAFYEKEKKQQREFLIAKADIKIATGVDLVNIYFQPCSGDYNYSKIQLHLAEGKFQSSGYGVAGNSKLIGGTIGNLLGEFKVEEGMMYKSITGLARGCYAIKLIQYNNKNEELITSDEKFFVIR